MKEVRKAGGIREAVPGAEELEQINRFAKRTLKAEEVYTFTVKLCDNEIDRDGERFPEETLRELAPMFVGKSGIFDHQWSAKGQTARIYRTEVVREETVMTAAGDGYCYLKGWAYMLRTEKNLPLIEEIEAGIKKEVSVGCAVSGGRCSVCGEEVKSGRCSHVPGQAYEGKNCWVDLVGARDAYEFSFVAVPAQPKAGVMKKSVKEERTTEQMEKEAALGRKYLESLRGDVIRLGGLAAPELKMETLKAITEKLEEEELLVLRNYCISQVERVIPGAVQLPGYRKSGKNEGRDTAFLI